MGDTLEENFAISDVEYEPEIVEAPVSKATSSKKLVKAPIEPIKAKKRNWREAVASGFSEAAAQCLLVREACNYKGGSQFTSIEFEDMRLTDGAFISLPEDCSKELSALEDCTPLFSELMGDSTITTPAILILTPSSARSIDISLALAHLKPLTLQLHGSGRKQEQFTRMKKDIASAKLIISVPSRIQRFCEEGAFAMEGLRLVLIDMHVDAKGLNALSMNETREAVAKLVTLHFRLNSGCRIILF